MSSSVPISRVMSQKRGDRGGFAFGRLAEALWIGLYFLLIAAPVVLLMLGPTPRGGGFWWDFSMGLGFTGLAMLGVQFVLTARFRGVCAPFGTDIIYYFHRWAAVGAALIAAHYLILRFGYGESLGTANVLKAPWHMTAGRIALILFVTIIVTSIFRKQLRIEYDWWRIVHGVLSAAAVVLAILHVRGVGYYTASPVRTGFWTGYSVIWLLVLLYLRLGKPLLLLRKPYRVSDIRAECGDSWTVTVKPSKAAGIRFAPGQFAWLTLGSSPFAGREHPFSFSGSAEVEDELQFTIKELGDFTRTIKNFKAGDVAYVDGPHGIFTPDGMRAAVGFVFIAGGVGIAPMMSILRTLADRGDERPMVLIYGNSSWDRVIFREDLEGLRKRLKLRIVHVLQSPPKGWHGENGMITPELIQRALGEEERLYEYFICGPVGMLSVVRGCLKALRIPSRRIRWEHFEMA